MAMEAVAVAPHAASLAARLEAGLDLLGVATSASQRRQLTDYVALLAKWNAVYNLTSIRDPADMLAVHVLDALSIVPLVDRGGGRTLLDVGSGAGIPAIPLSIVRPMIDVHSVDAVAKKIGFQLQARTTLGLENLRPLHARIEEVTLSSKPSVIVSRAFADIATMLAAIDHLAGETTQVIAMKGKTPTDELASLPDGWVVDRCVALEVPFLGAQRCAVVLKRASRLVSRP